MNKSSIIALVAGLIVGAALLYLLQPAAAETPDGLVDGKYLVVEAESGHWIYESTDEGLKLLAKEWSADGLSAIWELQSEYTPEAVEVSGTKLVSVPATRYSTETGAFQVVHNFYRIDGDKLVLVPMDNAQPAAGAKPGG